MTEFRIYYECLEQAHDYIAPMIREAEGMDITLVRMPKEIRDNYFKEGVMRAIYGLCVPDILITAVIDNREIPLVFIEFTDAVTTEDHELQRSAGAVAAYLAGIFYLKVSSDKQSRSPHGGANYNPYTSSRIFYEQLKYEGFIVAEWKVTENNKIRRGSDYKLFGCPPEIPILRETIRSAVIGLLDNEQQWFEIALSRLKKTKAFKKFERKRSQASTLDELLKVWKKRRQSTLRYHVYKDWVGAIIYRFSHAMDPDRGIISFISTLLSSELKVYGIYNIVRPRTEGYKTEVKEIESFKQRVEDVLVHDSAPSWFRVEIIKQLERARSTKGTFNVQEMWETNLPKVRSKVYKTLAYFTDGLYLGRGGPLIEWNRWKLLGVEGEHNITKFFEVIKQKFGFNEISHVTPIKPITEGVVEDEVTYAIVHRILLGYGFRLVAVSYPGAQGGYAVLPEADEQLGRAQARIYHDVVALPPVGNESFEALLNESKGMFRQADVEKDVEKLQPYKASESNKHQRGLQSLLVRAEVITDDHALRTILVGVSFGVELTTQTCWNPGTVDFVFCIVNRTHWKIGIFNQDLRDIISKIEGDTEFPQCYALGEALCQSQPLFR